MPFGPLINAVNCWILDYYCQSALREWAEKFEPTSSKYVRAANFLGDFSDELIVNQDLQFKLELISWLPRLHDLPTQHTTEEYSGIFKEMDATMKVCPESLSKETQDFFSQLKKQCLLLCCQKVGFSAATTLYVILEENDNFDEESNKELSNMLSSNDSNHRNLQGNIPSIISNIVSEYLQNHVIPSTTPFLITAATDALKDEEYLKSSAKPPAQKCIKPHLMIQLATKYNQNSTKTLLSLDDSEKEIFMNKLKLIWKENHLKYHHKLKTFEKHHKDKENQINPTPSVERPRRITTTYTVSPVVKTFPELKTMTVRESLRQPTLKKPTRTAYRIPWTTEQEEEFYLAVKKRGLGNWAAIRDYISFHKTNINLKDKWRNFHQSGKIKMLSKKFGAI